MCHFADGDDSSHHSADSAHLDDKEEDVCVCVCVCVLYMCMSVCVCV